MPVIRSPPQRRPQQSLKQGTLHVEPQSTADTSNNSISNDSDQENQPDAPRFGSSCTSNIINNKKPSVSQAIAAAKRQTTSMASKRSPSITVVADNTTRIWELEGEVSKLERDKRFLEDERRKFIDEREEERTEMRKEFASQLDLEKRRAQKELEACNSQWRAELDDTNARHEKKERELERKLVQTKETLKADLEADFNARIEVLEREKAKLKHEIELFALEMKEKQSLQSRVEYLEGELRLARESSSKSLIQAKEDLEHVRTELKLHHQAEMAKELEGLRSKLGAEHNELLQQNLESLRSELSLDHSNKLNSALETTRAEMRSIYEQELSTAQSRHEAEMRQLVAKESSEKQQLMERLRALEGENESLRASLWREQEARAREERQRIVDAELAQQRNDEAVARALSIVKRAEERIAQAVSSEQQHHQWKATSGTSSSQMPISTANRFEVDEEDEEADCEFAGGNVQRGGGRHPMPPPPPPPLHLPSSATMSARSSSTSLLNNGRMMRRNSLPAIGTSLLPSNIIEPSSRGATRRPSYPSNAQQQQQQQPSARAMRQSLLQQQQQQQTTSSPRRNNNNLQPNYLAQTQSSLAKLEQNEHLMFPNSPHRNISNNSGRRASTPLVVSRRW